MKYLIVSFISVTIVSMNLAGQERFRLAKCLDVDTLSNDTIYVLSAINLGLCEKCLGEVTNAELAVIKCLSNSSKPFRVVRVVDVDRVAMFNGIKRVYEHVDDMYPDVGGFTTRALVDHKGSRIIVVLYRGVEVELPISFNKDMCELLSPIESRMRQGNGTHFRIDMPTEGLKRK